MQSVIRNVRDINSRERQALEHVLGQELKDNQQIMIQVVTEENEPKQKEPTGDGTSTRLPDWCDVFAGLTDEQIAEVQKITLQRSDLSRPTA